MTMTAHSADAIVADATFDELRDYVISVTGLEFYADRPQTLAVHLADRFKLRGLDNCAAYWRLLQDEHAGEAELDHLIALLTIGETYFFRHRELFDALRDVALPEIIDRNRATKRLRVWSAGCSTGPEAYTVSVLLRRELGVAVQGWNITVLGTDINRTFLSQAAAGRYEEWAFRGTSPEFRRECFEQQENSWRISLRFKEGVTFQYHNLARHPFPSLVHNLLAFDLILCRNVLIYFAPAIVERIIGQIADCLVPGGWLAIGHAEHGPHLQWAFEAVNGSGATLYRKSGLQIARTTLDGAPLQPRIASPPMPLPGSSCFGLYRQKSAIPSCAPSASIHIGARTAPCNINSRAPTPSANVEQIRMLADQGNVDAALRLCEKLIAMNSLDPLYYFYHALLLDQVAGHDVALKELNSAIYLNREFELAHYYLGLTQQKLGNAAAAIKSFRNVLRLLEGRDRSDRLPDAEGMAIGDLEELTQMHIETLEEL